MDFFNKISRKASEVYNTTAEKTSKISRELKLKSVMNEDKNKIEQLYIEIGKKVYEKHIIGKQINIQEELSEELSKIDAYSKEIEDTLTEIRNLKDLALCEGCKKEINNSAKFCPSCGMEQVLEDNA